MNAEDDYWLIFIFLNISPGFDKLEFEKWRAIRASVGGVGGVLAWVTC